MQRLLRCCTAALHSSALYSSEFDNFLKCAWMPLHHVISGYTQLTQWSRKLSEQMAAGIRCNFLAWLSRTDHGMLHWSTMRMFAIIFTPWGRERELSTKKLTIQKKSQRYLTLFLMPVVIWERWTAYGMWAILISALITFSIQKQTLLLKRWAHLRKMVLCSLQRLDGYLLRGNHQCVWFVWNIG